MKPMIYSFSEEISFLFFTSWILGCSAQASPVAYSKCSRIDEFLFSFWSSWFNRPYKLSWPFSLLILH